MPPKIFLQHVREVKREKGSHGRRGNQSVPCMKRQRKTMERKVGRRRNIRRGLVARQGERPPIPPGCSHIGLLCVNGSDKLKTGLWKVVTFPKPLTATILHRGCEQLPACQWLTEIIAVPTGSFGRQMVEETPFICQQPLHNSHCPVKPGWEIGMQPC